jgi:2-oxoglutarate/2-oxoacid ferredoxin oxidoreductase subunit alpha
MAESLDVHDSVVIKFAGDSGDGMQLTGSQFTDSTALEGNDLATFPDFPAEIRAPQGTLAGVSGYQIHFGSRKIYTAGDQYDVLVAMNAAALKANLSGLAKGRTIIADTAGFDSKNLRLAGYEVSPLEDGSLSNYRLILIDVTKLTRECLKDSPLGVKEKDRSKNMFVLGFLYWMYNRNLDTTIDFLQRKFGKQPDILEANLNALKAGYHYGDTTETFTTRYRVAPAKLDPGSYRNIMGNQATVYGLIAASKKAGLDLFLGSYPITPASDILHMLSNYKNFGVRTFQAEDEIAAITSAIGASFGGHLALTSTSGPGMALKTEAMGLAVMLEIPLIILNIQRAGPSTGLPTKTEQADLLQAVYGRNGEAPIPVVAAKSPGDCFETVFEACRIALEHMTPVIFLSDGYIANGSEPWRYPQSEGLPKIHVRFAPPREEADAPFMPYARDERLVRQWAVPGTRGLEHRVGGLEKQDVTGNISYDPANHEHMVKTRAARVAKIADHIPEQVIEQGPDSGKLLVVGWGSTYGSIHSAVSDLIEAGHSNIAQVHLRHLNPFPRNLGEILHRFEYVLVPEINNGQLVRLLRDQYFVPAKGLNKIQGVPFTRTELYEAFERILAS